MAHEMRCWVTDRHTRQLQLHGLSHFACKFFSQTCIRIFFPLYNYNVLLKLLSGVMMCLCVPVQFLYNQVSLTQHTDRDSYSHQLVYPRRERFFIEPKSAASAVKCRISVSNSIRELSYLLVIPFSPKKGIHSS